MTKLTFKRVLKRVSIAIGVIGFIVLVWSNRTGKFLIKPFDYGGSLSPVVSDAVLPQNAIPVRLGIFLENIYDLNASTQSVAAEGVVWLSWTQVFQDLLDSKELTIEQVVAPANRVNSWDSITRPLYPKPKRMANGEYHQALRFGGRFYIPDFDLQRYPFERVRIPVVFGLHLMPEELGADKIRLVADVTQSGVGPYIDNIGFMTESFSVKGYVQRYPTRFGQQDQGQERYTEFSQVHMEISYKKSVNAAVQQLILPLAIVMLMVLFTPNLAASLWDVRIAIPSTALLTLIFLQQSYRQTLPSLPYLTSLDKIYVSCYLVTFALFALFVWTSNQIDGVAEHDRAAVIARLNRIDARFQLACFVYLVVTSIGACFFLHQSVP